MGLVGLNRIRKNIPLGLLVMSRQANEQTAKSIGRGRGKGQEVVVVLGLGLGLGADSTQNSN